MVGSPQSKTSVDAVNSANHYRLSDFCSIAGERGEQGSSSMATAERRSAKVFDRMVSSKFRGRTVRTGVAGPETGERVLLVHGFGATCEHWRNVVPSLVSSGYRVLAPDLLGFGSSDKPESAELYCMETWASQLLEINALNGRDGMAPKSLVDSSPPMVAAVGNSIGSLASLEAARQGGPSTVAGACLLNCAGGQNSKALAFSDWRTALLYPLLKLVDLALMIDGVPQALLERIRTEDTVRNLLQAVYHDQSAVDQELVDFIREPAFSSGASASLRNVLSNSPGPNPFEIINQLDSSQKLLTIWGEDDIIAPIGGLVGRWFANTLPEEGSGSVAEFVRVQDCNRALYYYICLII